MVSAATPQPFRLTSPYHDPLRRALFARAKTQTSTTLRHIEDVNELVRDIEADRKSIPVLLRQYLKLNAVLLGFNVDPDFGDVLDGLMLVDLRRVNRAVLNRYMGPEQAAEYLAHHGLV